jgi:hypothetical protein
MRLFLGSFTKALPTQAARRSRDDVEAWEQKYDLLKNVQFLPLPQGSGCL